MRIGDAATRNRLVAIALILIGPLPAFDRRGNSARPCRAPAGHRPRQSASWSAFLDALGDRGWIDGHNLQFYYRTSEGRPERYQELAAELVGLQPEVIIAWGSAGTQALREKTSTIPIVTLGADDPVRLSFAASLAHPGGNITGIFNQAADTFEKAFEFLMEVRPSISRVALFWAPAYPASRLCKAVLEAAAPRIGVAVEPIGVNEPAELDPAFATVTQSRPML